MKLSFDPIWAWPWVILAAAITLASVITTYRRRIAHLPARSRTVLLWLRVLAWAILIFSFLRPALEFTRTNSHASVFLVLLDASRSMGVKDASAGMSRREALLKTLADCRNDLERLGRDIEIKLFDFGEDLAPVETPEDKTPGEQTAIGHVLDAAAKAVQGKQVVGMLLGSDGANRAMAPNDIDPRAAAARLADQQIPVDTIGFGASGLTDSTIDLAAEDLEVSPTVFVKNTVTVSAKVRALGAADREVVVRLLIEDPGAALAGGVAPMKLATPPVTLKPRANQDLLSVEGLSFVAQDPGEFRLTLEVVPLEGEPLTSNNSLTTYMTVLKGGISVAYFDREHRAEMKFIRRTDESPDIRLDLKPIRLPDPGAKSPIEADWFEPDRYDVYIIGSVPARLFGEDLLAKLAQRVEQGAGLLMTGGTLSFGPGGYAGTALADLLPVRMQRTELQNGEEVDPALHYDEPLQMIPTAQGVQHFVMRIDAPDKNMARWQALPPLDGGNRFNDLKSGAIVLAESAAGRHPLLVAQQFGRGRVMAFACDSTFLWYLARPRHEEHQRFWQQVIHWLAHKDQQGDESVWLKLDARRFRVGQPVGLEFGARDGQKRPIDDATFKIEVTGPDKTKRVVAPQRSGTDHVAKFLETREPGEYRVRVEAESGGQSIGLPAESRFIVYEQDLELHNPAADFTLLDEISRITGGTTVPPEELGAHLRRRAREGLNVEITEIERVTLWDHWPLLVLFSLTLSAEWYVRKRRGLV
jgi:hypothetical protein